MILNDCAIWKGLNIFRHLHMSWALGYADPSETSQNTKMLHVIGIQHTHYAPCMEYLPTLNIPVL